MILLISAIQGAHFCYSSQGFFFWGGGGGGEAVFFYRAFLSGSVLSSTPYIGCFVF